jgi:hypothetical protein
VVLAGRQIQRADETMTLTPETPVTFVRLVPLRDGEDQVRRWSASDAIEYAALDDGEHRLGICEERLSGVTDDERAQPRALSVHGFWVGVGLAVGRLGQGACST